MADRRNRLAATAGAGLALMACAALWAGAVPWTGRPAATRPGATPATVPAASVPKIAQEFARDPAASRLPDFSYAGYRGGQLPLEVKGPLFKVEDFGAKADDGLDDVAAIQRAVDAAAAKGGGVVVLGPGQYDIDVERVDGDRAGSRVKIRTSNIVIRGAGSGAKGTVLMDHRFSDSPDPKASWRANEFPGFFHVSPVEASALVGYRPDPGPVVSALKPAARNATTIELAAGSAVKEGEVYLLCQTDTGGTLVKALTVPMTRLAAGYAAPDLVRFQQYVKVTKLQGNVATISAPLRWELKAEWKPALHRVPMVSEVGIESMRLKTAWKGPFRHHASVEGNDGWNHIRIDCARDSWVKDVVHEGTTMGVMLASSFNCLVTDGKIEGPVGHNGYVLIGCTTDSMLRNLDGGRAFHTFQFQEHPVGNVVLDCRGAEGATIDGHGGLAVANLVDGMVGAVWSGGGADRAVPPRHAQGLVLWNWQVGRESPYGRRDVPFMKVNEAPGFIAVGVRGRDGQAVRWQDASNKDRDADADEPGAYVESLGAEPGVASLYQWQRIRRGLAALK